MSDTSTAPAWNSPDYETTERGDRGQAMLAAANALDMSPQEGVRQDWNLHIAQLFESQPITSVYMYTGRYFGGNTVAYGGFVGENRSIHNVMRSVCMTSACMVGRSRPRARIITTNGDYKRRRRALGSTDFCSGWAEESDLYSTTQDCLVDAHVFDFGVLQLYKENNKVKVQRILPSEIRWDPLDALYGQPSVTYRRRFERRRALKARFARKGMKNWQKIAAAIDEAKTVDPIGTDVPSDCVRVEEAWSLPTHQEKNPKTGKMEWKGGYHIIAVEAAPDKAETGTLFEEEWTKPYFPLLYITFEKARAGNAGVSAATQLEPIQLFINKTMNRIIKALHLFAVPRVGIKRGSKIVKSALSNLIAGAVEYTDTPPQALVWPVMPPEVYKFLEDQEQKCYDLLGISRNAAQGQKEAGVVSGAAIRESLDVQATRVQTLAQRWERFHVDIFKIAIDMVGDIVEEVGTYKVKVPGSNEMEAKDWKETGIDEEEGLITVWPTNELPITPQGKLDYVKDMLSAGLWDADRARAVFSDLDTEGAENAELAIYNLMRKKFEQMLFEGQPQHPDEFTPYPLALKMGGQYIARAEDEGAPAKWVDLGRRFLDETKKLQDAITSHMAQLPGQGPSAGAPAPGSMPGLGASPTLAPLSPLPAMQ